MSRKGSDTKTLRPLSGVLTDALAGAGFGNVVTLVQLKRNWDEIAGTQLARVSQPVRFKWGELLVSVDDALWLHQMTFFQAKLRDRIRSVVGDATVSKLRFVLAYSSHPPLGSPTPVEAPIQPQILTAEEECLVQSGTAGISHAGLRAAANRAWRQDLLAKR